MGELTLDIVAAAARTAVGRTLAASVAAVRAGLAGFEVDPELYDGDDKRIVTARARWLPSELTPAERVARLAQPAICQALWPLRERAQLRVAAFVGVSDSARAGRPSDLNEVVQEAVRAAVTRSGKLVELELVAKEHASGLLALEVAQERLANGRADVCLVGGVDSYLDHDMIAGLESGDRLRTSRQRFGFTPGEASAFLVLAPRATAPSPALATIAGVASARETAPIARSAESEAPPAVVTGKALHACFERAAARDPQIDRLIGDLNGEPHRADELGMALVRFAKRIAQPPQVLAPAATWGDVGAASGPLSIGVAIEAFARGWGAPRTLVFASSDAGERAAALVVPARVLDR